MFIFSYCHCHYGYLIFSSIMGSISIDSVSRFVAIIYYIDSFFLVTIVTIASLIVKTYLLNPKTLNPKPLQPKP